MRGDGVASATIGAVGAEGASMVRGVGAPVITSTVICIRARVGARLARNRCQVQEHERGGSAHHFGARGNWEGNPEIARRNRPRAALAREPTQMITKKNTFDVASINSRRYIYR